MAKEMFSHVEPYLTCIYPYTSKKRDPTQIYYLQKWHFFHPLAIKGYPHFLLHNAILLFIVLADGGGCCRCRGACSCSWHQDHAQLYVMLTGLPGVDYIPFVKFSISTASGPFPRPSPLAFTLWWLQLLAFVGPWAETSPPWNHPRVCELHSWGPRDEDFHKRKGFQSIGEVE